MGCEGDIGSTMVAVILQELGGTPAAIVEPFAIDESKNRILLGHPCGSTAIAFADSVSTVHFRPVKPDEGVFVQFPVKPGSVTIANISGRMGNYRMFIATARTVEVIDEWSRRGGIVAGIQFNENARLLLSRLIQQEGIDHHWIIAFADLENELSELCNFLEVRPVLLQR